MHMARRARVRRWAATFSLLFLALALAPRASFVVHSHAGGERSHLHFHPAADAAEPHSHHHHHDPPHGRSSVPSVAWDLWDAWYLWSDAAVLGRVRAGAVHGHAFDSFLPGLLPRLATAFSLAAALDDRLTSGARCASSWIAPPVARGPPLPFSIP